jgi:hypothetical protein
LKSNTTPGFFKRNSREKAGMPRNQPNGRLNPLLDDYRTARLAGMICRTQIIMVNRIDMEKDVF